MLNTFYKLFKTLEYRYKKKVIILQILNIVISICEIITLSLLALFITLVANPKNIKGNESIEFVLSFLNINNDYNFLFLFGSFALIFYIFTTLLNIYVTWTTNLFSQTLVQYFTSKIIKSYASKDWISFSKIKLSEINKDIYTDTNILANSMIVPFFNLINKLFLTISIAFVLALYNFKISILGLTIYVLIYSLLILFVKKITKKITFNISENRKNNHHLINSFFSGFKEMIIFNLIGKYYAKIKENNLGMIYPASYLMSLSQIPRFFVELISYIFIISFILIVIKNGEDLQILLPTVTIYAFAGLKLLPAFQQIYLAYIRIKSGKAAFKNLYPKLKQNIQFEKNIIDNFKKFEFKNKFVLKKIFFSYIKNQNKKDIRDINLEIKKKSIVGFAGLSGSGKSTIVDLIAGLLKPSKGYIEIDGKRLPDDRIREWQNNFSIVTQTPFMFNNTLYENITLGHKRKSRNVKELIRKIELSNLIKKRKFKLKDELSDKGQNVSGGERQRIAIARSLYFDADIIIFDEATNALDEVTEKKIIKNINRLREKKTIIIITHRAKTLKFCDNIYLIKDGKIKTSGKFNQLKKRSKYFRDLLGQD